MTAGATSRVDRVLDGLRTVDDPELGLDIVSMGLVCDVRDEGDRVVVEITLTTPGCPVSERLPDDAWSAALDALGPAGTASAEVVVVWDPPWTPERLSDEARTALGTRGR